MADLQRLERAIAGALKSAIDAHGPITPERIGSAAKRVRCQLAAHEAELLAEADSLRWGDPRRLVTGSPDPSSGREQWDEL